MKDKEIHTAKKKSFLKLPRYSGDRKAFMEFVSANLIYPEEALKNGIEGIVYSEYEVDHLGKISDIKIKKGVGYGCDEEAIRLISLMVYEPVRNRGLRIKSKMKTRILFKLPAPVIENPENSVNLEYTITKKKDQKKDENPSYSYTIHF